MLCPRCHCRVWAPSCQIHGSLLDHHAAGHPHRINMDSAGSFPVPCSTKRKAYLLFIRLQWPFFFFFWTSTGTMLSTWKETVLDATERRLCRQKSACGAIARGGFRLLQKGSLSSAASPASSGDGMAPFVGRRMRNRFRIASSRSKAGWN